MALRFDWDPTKALINAAKHGVHFELASTIFRDPNAVTIPDEEHSLEEERWITMGTDRNANLLVVVHTSARAATGDVTVRIISARPATRNEARQYEEQAL